MTRHLAIGDVHGCANAFKTLLSYVELRDDDTVIMLGDYVDRGPDSRAVVDTVIELGNVYDVIPLRGNHEIMMLDSREKKSWFHAWMTYGGDATLNSYAASPGETGSFADIPDSHIDFFENKLRPYYECEAHFFVHANVDAKIALTEQPDAALYWKKYRNPERHCSGKFMVCGHTAQRSGLPSGNEHSICIDTWAYGEGWLSCFDVESGTIWQANEAGATRSFPADQGPGR